jgi:mono/diheme cytochrome c family protein
MRAAGRLGLSIVAALGFLAAFLAVGRIASPGHSPGEALADDSGLTDPFLGQADAISEGDDLYHSKCIGCHGLKGGRGPNLFATKLTDDQFLEVVINGRQGTLMPAWGFRLSPDDVWKIHAFLKAHPDGLSL